MELMMLIDPPPVDVGDGKVMVFRNPMAAEILTKISACARTMLAGSTPVPPDELLKRYYSEHNAQQPVAL